jgi:Ca2+/Na+ antiporter
MNVAMGIGIMVFVCAAIFIGFVFFIFKNSCKVEVTGETSETAKKTEAPTINPEANFIDRIRDAIASEDPVSELDESLSQIGISENLAEAATIRKNAAAELRRAELDLSQALGFQKGNLDILENQIARRAKIEEAQRKLTRKQHEFDLALQKEQEEAAAESARTKERQDDESLLSRMKRENISAEFDKKKTPRLKAALAFFMIVMTIVGLIAIFEKVNTESETETTTMEVRNGK